MKSVRTLPSARTLFFSANRRIRIKAIKRMGEKVTDFIELFRSSEKRANEVSRYC